MENKIVFEDLKLFLFLNAKCPFCNTKQINVWKHLRKHDIDRNDCLDLLAKSTIGNKIIQDNKSNQFMFLRGKNSFSQKYDLEASFIEDFLKYSGEKIRLKADFQNDLANSEIGQKVKKLYLKNTPIKQITEQLKISKNDVKSICKKLGILKSINIPMTSCFICNASISRASISAHLKNHNMLIKNYKELIIDDFLKNKEKVEELKYWYLDQRVNQRFIYEKFNFTLDILKQILILLKIRIRKNNESISGNLYWFMYKNEFYQSSWELQFAWWLEYNNIEFQSHSKIGYFDYEDSQANNKKRKYFPDFFVPSWNCYIEIKGRFDKEVAQKMKDIQRCNPGLNIKVLRKSYFIKNNIFKIEQKIEKNIYDYAWFLETKELQIDFLKKNKEEIFEILCTQKDAHKKIIKKFKVRYHVLYRFLKLCKEELKNYKTERTLL